MRATPSPRTGRPPWSLAVMDQVAFCPGLRTLSWRRRTESSFSFQGTATVREPERGLKSFTPNQRTVTPPLCFSVRGRRNTRIPPPSMGRRSSKEAPPHTSTCVKASSSEEPMRNTAVSPTRYWECSGMDKEGIFVGTLAPVGSTASTMTDCSALPPHGSAERKVRRYAPGLSEAKDSTVGLVLSKTRSPPCTLSPSGTFWYICSRDGEAGKNPPQLTPESLDTGSFSRRRSSKLPSPLSGSPPRLTRRASTGNVFPAVAKPADGVI